MTTPSDANTAPLNEVILEKAGELFRQQGYAATSIKQIAKAAGCTNAALYYYFEGGKQHILHQVIRHSAQERIDLLAATEEVESLPDLIVQISKTMGQAVTGMASRINWLIIEFPTLPEEEQELLRNQLLDFHTRLNTQIGRFVADDETVNRLAWLIFCAFLGYRQIFGSLGMGQVSGVSFEMFGQFLADTIGDAS